MCSQLVVWLSSGLLEGVSPSVIQQYPHLLRMKEKVYDNSKVKAFFGRQSSPDSSPLRVRSESVIVSATAVVDAEAENRQPVAGR